MKGYSETQPTVSNTNPDGSDNPVNRREEFGIDGIKE